MRISRFFGDNAFVDCIIEITMLIIYKFRILNFKQVSDFPLKLQLDFILHLIVTETAFYSIVIKIEKNQKTST